MIENIENKPTPEQQEQLVEDLQNRILKVVRSVDSKGNLELLIKLGDFGEHLRNHYPNFVDYRLYHILGGSNFHGNFKPPLFDFPGEDSVERFIKEKI